MDDRLAWAAGGVPVTKGRLFFGLIEVQPSIRMRLADDLDRTRKQALAGRRRSAPLPHNLLMADAIRERFRRSSAKIINLFTARQAVG